MSRWQIINGLSLSDPEHKYWYWIHLQLDGAELRHGPFTTLIACVEDAKAHGLSDYGVVVGPVVLSGTSE